MHKYSELGLPYAKAAKLYVENGGRWVLHVWTGVPASDTQARATLEKALDVLMADHKGYSEYVVHSEGADDASPQRREAPR